MYIKNGSLTIRDATLADAPLLGKWWRDGGVMAHAGFPNGLTITDGEIAESLKNDTDETHRRLIIEADSIAIGEMNYRRKGDNIAEIGIKICDFSMQNKGLGTRFLRMLIEALFSRGYEKIILDTNFNNKRAQHVYEKIGFIKVGERVDSWKNQLGEPQSSIDYELTKTGYIEQLNEITYVKIDSALKQKIITWFGDAIAKYDMLPDRDDCYRVAAMCEEQVIGFTAAAPVAWTSPLEQYCDIFIHSIEVDESFRRRGIGRRLITMLENWTQNSGYRQIRAWSSYESPEALHMWYAMGYAMCPAVQPIYENGKVSRLNPGYYYAKILNLKPSK